MVFCFKKYFGKIVLSIIAFFLPLQGFTNYCSVHLDGQFGNQLFQLMAGYAYSLDNNLTFVVPDLQTNQNFNIPHNYKRLFSRLFASGHIPVKLDTYQPDCFQYRKIPPFKNVKLVGYFQSEKYFKHHRKDILKLFQIPEKILEKYLQKYPQLSENTVGVQIRDYRKDVLNGQFHPTYGRSYYEKAFAKFGKHTIFFVSSNNKSFAKECTKNLSNNIIYLDEDDYIDEFFILTLCRSFIISNSSFGWWAAWLSKSENKHIFAPSPWFSKPYISKNMEADLVPQSFVQINSRPIE